MEPESCTTCSVDCGACLDCGDGFCGQLESYVNCPGDCGSSNAPVVISSFLDSATASILTITFNSSITTPQGYACGKLVANFEKVLGEGASCHLSSQYQQLTIQLGWNATLRLGDYLQFIPGSIDSGGVPLVSSVLIGLH